MRVRLRIADAAARAEGSQFLRAFCCPPALQKAGRGYSDMLANVMHIAFPPKANMISSPRWRPTSCLLWLSALQSGRPHTQWRRHGLRRTSGTHSLAQRPVFFLVERAHATRGFVILPAVRTSTGLRPELLSRLPCHLAAPVALSLLCLLARLAVAARLGS